jgi:serine protease AprX
MSVLLVNASAAQTTDDAVRAAVASGTSARVIMQFPTTDERDAAYHRLLDRGAAVRAADTGGGPALVVFGSAAAFSSEFGHASQVSLDARVSVQSGLPARAGNARKASNAGRKRQPDDEGARSRNGITVAVVDSGIQPHRDLPANRIRMFKDFVTGGSTPIDTCGHGTHVAGIIAGSGAASAGEYAGIAPDADIVALRVLGDDCTGDTSDVIDALEWIAQNHERYRIKVVNMSLGHDVLESIFTDPLVQAVERLSRKGIVVVTAAGNKGINPATGLPGYGGIGVPCNAPSAVCVGSLDDKGTLQFADDRVAGSSSRGPTRFDLLAKPDLVAHGVGIVSLAAPGSRLYEDYPELRVGDSNGEAGYFTLSGTSMASPAVAGAAALIVDANAKLSANAIKMILQFTSRVVANTDVLTQGAGALNAGGGLELAGAVNPQAEPGTIWITRRLVAANLDAAGRTVNWGRRIIYGDRFMQRGYAGVNLRRWSDDIVWAYDAIAENIVWGDDDNIVWGNDDNIVWGNEDNIVWGNSFDDNIVWGNDEGDNIVWGNDDNIVWGNDDNIVWGNDDNIVWGNGTVRGQWAANVVRGFWDGNIVWGNVTRDAMDNIVWGNDDNIVWGNCLAGTDNIVWGNDDNIVWGNCDNIVWGNSVLTRGRQ